MGNVLLGKTHHRNGLILYQRQILDWSKLQAFADNKINVAQKLKYALGTVENIMGKVENAGSWHFLLLLQCCQKAFSARSLKVRIMWYRVKPPFHKVWRR